MRSYCLITLLLFPILAPAFAADLEPEDFALSLRDAMGDFCQEHGFTFDLSGGERLVLKAGPDELPQVNGILDDYVVWLTPRTQLVIYVKPERNLKADIEHFIAEATKRGIPFKRIPKPGSDDVLVTFGPGGKQTDMAVAFCLKNTPVMPPGP